MIANDRAERLRQIIQHYERMLREGVTAELAVLYLQDLAEARKELRALEEERSFSERSHLVAWIRLTH